MLERAGTGPVRRALSLMMFAVLLPACEGDVAGTGNDVGGFAGGPSGPGLQTAGPNGGGLPGTTASGAAGVSGVGAGGLAGPQGVAGSGGQADAACASAAPDAGATPLRRLTTLEYQLTLQDLFSLEAPPDIEGVPADAEQNGFTTFAELQTLSAQHLRGYLDVAARLGQELIADASRRDQVIGCALQAPDCLRSFIARFGKLAYRRPLTDEELSSIETAATRDALDAEDRYRYVIEALLVSPSFLYRVEVGAGGEGVATLNAYEFASRLSFALWGRAPDAWLLERAEAGALDSPASLEEVVETMLADDRTALFLENFFAQWLGFKTLRSPRMPAADWDDALLDDMAEETRAVVADFAFGGRDFLDVLTTNTTRVSRSLASYYGLPAPAADDSVAIPEDHPRAHTGLLTHGSLISAKSDGDSIAKRGNWVRKTFLCRALEVPPEIAETFGERLVGLTRVEIVRERNTDPTCRGCHAMIDPIGVAFEPFDESGRYREGVDIAAFGIEPGLPDAPDPAFSTLAELAGKLRALPDVGQCLTERAFLYENGREPAQADRCAVERTVGSFTASGHDFRALLRTLVAAPEFRLRRAPEALP